VTSPSATELDSAFHVPAALDLLGGLVVRYRPFWLALAQLESAVLASDLKAIPLTMPIFICGLARSGSTLLHEIVATHPDVATHRAKDYPLVFLPYWWRRATAGQPPAIPQERAHRDGILVSPDSPDALEEMLWMAFFPTCHDNRGSNLLGAGERYRCFEAFFRLHLRKLLLVEKASRYVAKANYHVARLPYLLGLFPDARFIIPVRAPETHVASLLRQQRWFSTGQRRHPRALAFMRRSGHYEFGLDRRPMNLGDGGRVRQILEAWACGDEVRGWALSWDMVYSYLDSLLESDSRVREAAMVVRFEELCESPLKTIHAVLEHCRLLDPGLAEQFVGRVRLPDYYKSPLNTADREVIRQETAATARRWGF
jgi:hypothetical protein